MEWVFAGMGRLEGQNSTYDLLRVTRCTMKWNVKYKWDNIENDECVSLYNHIVRLLFTVLCLLLQ